MRTFAAKAFILLATLGCLVWGFYALSNTASDVQLGIATAAFVGAAVLIGLLVAISCLEIVYDRIGDMSALRKEIGSLKEQIGELEVVSYESSPYVSS